MPRCSLLAVVLVLILPLALHAQAKPGEAIQTEDDITYGKGGTQELKLDLAMPKEGKGPFPTVICIHGGGWQKGSRKDLGQTIKYLAGNGYVAAAVTYRLAPDAKFPCAVQDCKCAVRWLRANAGKYKIDPNRIGALGMSAGAHLASMLGLTAPEDGFEGSGGHPAESSRVQAVVSIFGPTDLTKGDWDPMVQPLLTDFLGGTLEEKPDVYRRASPLIYVRKGQTPPFLFFHGTKDPIVRYDQSVALQIALRAAGGQADLIPMEGEGHGWRGEKLVRTIEQMTEFFDRTLKKKG